MYEMVLTEATETKALEHSTISLIPDTPPKTALRPFLVPSLVMLSFMIIHLSVLPPRSFLRKI